MLSHRTVMLVLFVLFLLLACSNLPSLPLAVAPAGLTPSPLPRVTSSATGPEQATRPASSALPPVTSSATGPEQATRPASTSSAGVNPQPLDVVVKLDAGKAVSQTITSAGGTLRATAADGTRFTVTIPQDALVQDQTITLTPVSGIPDLHLTGKTLAVLQMAPEGLSLFKPATLLVEPSVPIPLQEQISFAYQGTGEDLHLFPLTRDPATITFQVMHFSGYGVGQGNASDAKNISGHTAGSAEARAESSVGSTLNNTRTNHGDKITDGDAKEIGNALNDWYNGGVKGDLAAAETDSSSLDAAAMEFLRWWNDVELFNLEDRFSQQLEAAWQSLAKGILLAYKEATAKCDLGQMAQLSKKAELWRLESYQPELDWPNVLKQIQKCQVFELEVGGRMQGIDVYEYDVVPLTKIPLSRTGEELEGYAELTAQWDPPLSGYCQSYAEPVDQPWTLKVKATNNDELFRQNSIIHFDIELTWKGDVTNTDICYGGGTFPGEFENVYQITFQLQAQDGAKYDWRPESMDMSGSTTFTFRDPTHYLEKAGRISPRLLQMLGTVP